MTYKRTMDFAPSLDEAILDALAASSREQVAIFRPYFDPGTGPDGFIETIKAQNAENDREYQAWREAGLAQQKYLSDLFETYEILPHHIAVCRKAAELVEQSSFEYAKEIDQQAKQLNALYKEFKRIDRSKADLIRECFTESLDRAKQEVEDRLSFALLMRALAAEHDPDRKVVARASSPSEVDDVLRQFMQ